MGISLTRHWVISKSTLDIQKEPSLLGTGSCLSVGACCHEDEPMHFITDGGSSARILLRTLHLPLDLHGGGLKSTPLGYLGLQRIIS